MSLSCKLALLFAATFIAMSQSPNRAANSPAGQAIWEPPSVWDSDQLPAPTIPKEMISTVRIGDFKVVLEDTPLAALQKHFGGEMGHRGDAADALSWLCLTG